MDEMNIPDGFTFNSTKEVDISIIMPQSIDFTTYRGRFDIYTGNPANGGKRITSGSFDQNGTFNGTI